MESDAEFRERFIATFESQFPRLRRYLDRLSGDPDLASDLAQEAFVRLYRRGGMPDEPEAWLVTVALNLFRNQRARRQRRKRLLPPWRAEATHGDPPPSPADAAVATDASRRARAALDGLDERERELLVLRAEGYAYREIAASLDLNEASVGTLLARARRAFRRAYEDPHAP